MKMAETIVENEICLTCGTELPNDALFCYSCGNSVDPEAISDANDTDEDVGSALFDEDISEETEDTGELETEDLEEVEVDKIDGDESKNPDEIDETSLIIKPEGDVSQKTEESAEIEEKPKLKKEELKSAASIRVKSKIKQQKKVEISWEEHENSPNIWFIGVALFLTAVAVCAYYLAMYLR